MVWLIHEETTYTTQSNVQSFVRSTSTVFSCYPGLINLFQLITLLQLKLSLPPSHKFLSNNILRNTVKLAITEYINKTRACVQEAFECVSVVMGDPLVSSWLSRFGSSLLVNQLGMDMALT